MGETIRTLQNEGQEPHQVVPHLVAAYQVALQYQHYIVEQNNKALQKAQREDYLRIVAASTQFAAEVSLSINYSRLSAEQRAEDIGKSLLQALTIKQASMPQKSSGLVSGLRSSRTTFKSYESKPACTKGP